MRRIARIQQRKRQAWLALPASGIEEVGHGCRTERPIGQDRGEEEVRLHCMAGTRQALAELMAWSDTARGGRQFDMVDLIARKDSQNSCSSAYGLCE